MYLRLLKADYEANDTDVLFAWYGIGGSLSQDPELVIQTTLKYVEAVG